jgi:hypothetical protein
LTIRRPRLEPGRRLNGLRRFALLFEKRLGALLHFGRHFQIYKKFQRADAKPSSCATLHKGTRGSARIHLRELKLSWHHVPTKRRETSWNVGSFSKSP